MADPKSNQERQQTSESIQTESKDVPATEAPKKMVENSDFELATSPTERAEYKTAQGAKMEEKFDINAINAALDKAPSPAADLEKAVNAPTLEGAGKVSANLEQKPLESQAMPLDRKNIIGEHRSVDAQVERALQDLEKAVNAPTLEGAGKVSANLEQKPLESQAVPLDITPKEKNKSLDGLSGVLQRMEKAGQNEAGMYESKKDNLRMTEEDFKAFKQNVEMFQTKMNSYAGSPQWDLLRESNPKLHDDLTRVFRSIANIQGKNIEDYLASNDATADKMKENAINQEKDEIKQLHDEINAGISGPDKVLKEVEISEKENRIKAIESGEIKFTDTSKMSPEMYAMLFNDSIVKGNETLDKVRQVLDKAYNELSTLNAAKQEAIDKALEERSIVKIISDTFKKLTGMGGKTTEEKVSKEFDEKIKMTESKYLQDAATIKEDFVKVYKKQFESINATTIVEEVQDAQKEHDLAMKEKGALDAEFAKMQNQLSNASVDIEFGNMQKELDKANVMNTTANASETQSNAKEEQNQDLKPLIGTSDDVNLSNFVTNIENTSPDHIGNVSKKGTHVEQVKQQQQKADKGIHTMSR